MIYKAIVNSGGSNEFTHTFNQTIQKVRGYKINGVSIPVAYYRVRDNNNKLTIIQSATTYNLTLTNGDYSDTSLVAEVQTQLQTINANFTATLSGHSITLTHSTTAFDVDFLTCYYLLGFNETGSYTGLLTYTGENAINLYGAQVVHLLSDTIGTCSLSNSYNNVVDNYLIDETYGGIYIRSFENPDFIEITPKNISSIHFKLVFDDGEVYTSNGLPVLISMTIYA